jgi:uncharacterized membrane protein YkoI
MDAMKYRVNAFLLTVGLALSLVMVSNTVFSSGDERHWEDDDHTYDRARRAVDRGETLPVAELLKRLETQVPGEVVGMEFEREHGRWIYEFKLIDTRGRLLEVYVDGQSGAVLSMEED